MTLWLECKEKIQRHNKFIEWKQSGCPPPPIVENLHPGIIYERKLTMPKHPTQKAIEREAISFDVPFNAVPVFQRIKFSTSDPYANDGPTDSIVDSIHVQPQKTLKNGDHIPARFDTALINTGAGGKVGIEGYRIAQVKVVFTLPPRLAKTILPLTIVPPKYLAYVEWFSSFKPQLERYHLMYKVSSNYGESLAKFPQVICAVLKICDIWGNFKRILVKVAEMLGKIVGIFKKLQVVKNFQKELQKIAKEVFPDASDDCDIVIGLILAGLKLDHMTLETQVIVADLPSVLWASQLIAVVMDKSQHT
ncbi:hypothetical protein C8R44DRAFT_755450 [Mycena epipterygia]|nr:hypothetical protein C8R44DRAFT_755450 [Mycena epipterygia]